MYALYTQVFPQHILNLGTNSSRTVYCLLLIGLINRQAVDHSGEQCGLKACAACDRMQALTSLNPWISYQGHAVFEFGSMLCDVKGFLSKVMTAIIWVDHIHNHTNKIRLIPTIRLVCRSSAVSSYLILGPATNIGTAAFKIWYRAHFDPQGLCQLCTLTCFPFLFSLRKCQMSQYING